MRAARAVGLCLGSPVDNENPICFGLRELLRVGELQRFKEKQ